MFGDLDVVIVLLGGTFVSWCGILKSGGCRSGDGLWAFRRVGSRPESGVVWSGRVNLDGAGGDWFDWLPPRKIVVVWVARDSHGGGAGNKEGVINKEASLSLLSYDDSSQRFSYLELYTTLLY